MARPTVPHCKQCRYHQVLGDKFFHANVRFAHVCKMKNRSVSGQEVRTSPVWCPLRARGWRHSAF